MSESSDQAALFSLLNTLAGCDASGRIIAGSTPRLPLLMYVLHVPNEANGGGEKTKKGIPLEAITNARVGVRAGVPDLLFPVTNQRAIEMHPVGTLFGCAIELKAHDGRLRPDQRRWLAHLAAHGWYTETFFDWTKAARLLIAWAGGDPKEIEGL